MGRRIRIIVGLALLAAALLGAFPGLTGSFTGGPAGAQESVDEAPGGGTPGDEAPADEAPAERIFGTIKDGDGEPIEGVAIIVELNGDATGEVETAADGTFEVALPGAGTYQVTLDEDSLPDGVALRDPDRATLDKVLIRPGQARAVLFAIGESSGAASPTRLERALNRFVGGLRLGLIIAVAGVGLTLVFGTTGLVNFAQGELVTLGALVAWFLNAGAGGPGWSLILAGILAVIAGGLFSAGTDLVLWRPLRRRHTGPVAAMVVSIGLALFLRHIYLVVFEGKPRPFADYTVQRAWDLDIVEIVPKDLAIMVIAAAALVSVGILLEMTRIGTAIRAVSDNRDLSEASGIDVERVILVVWIACGALSALGGVLLGLTESVQWDMGMRILLVMFAAVILGGLGSAYGAMLGGILVGVVSEMSTYWFPTDYKVVFALGALILVLLVRPQGIMGIRERVG